MNLDADTNAATQRLLAIANSDTGQAKRVANFLLAWWNTESLGGFDFSDIACVDRQSKDDMATIFLFITRQSDAIYPDQFRSQIEKVIERWRPEIFEEAGA